MTFPSSRSAATVNIKGSNSTAHNNIVCNTTIESGDRLIAFFNTADGDPTVTWDQSSAGTWTKLTSGAAASSTAWAEIWTKIADGTEDSNVLTINTVDGKQSVGIVVCLKDAGSGIEYSAIATATGTGPNSGSLTPSWGPKDTTFITYIFGDNGDVTISTWPANYVTDQTEDNTAGGIGTFAALATDGVNAASEDPGAWVISSSQETGAITIAIEPATVSPTVITLDNASPQPGDTIKVTAASALAGVLGDITFNRGGTITPNISPAPTTLEAFYDIPSAPFTSTNMPKVLFDEAGTIYVTGGGEDSATTAITVGAPTPKNSDGANVFFRQYDGNYFADSIIPVDAVAGDYFYAEITDDPGNMRDINDKGIRDAKAFPVTVTRTMWTAASESWQVTSAPGLYVWEPSYTPVDAESVGSIDPTTVELLYGLTPVDAESVGSIDPTTITFATILSLTPADAEAGHSIDPAAIAQNVVFIVEDAESVGSIDGIVLRHVVRGAIPLLNV